MNNICTSSSGRRWTYGRCSDYSSTEGPYTLRVVRRNRMATDEEHAAGDVEDKKWIDAEVLHGDRLIASDVINDSLAVDRAMRWCEEQMEKHRASSHPTKDAQPPPASPAHAASATPIAEQRELMPPLPLRNCFGPYCEVPWLAGRIADGRYSLETGEYQMIIGQADLRAWAQRIVDQVDADIVRESKKVP